MRALRGCLVDTPAFGDVRVREDALLVLSAAGQIVAVEDGSAEARTLQAHGVPASDVQRLKVGCAWACAAQLHAAWPWCGAGSLLGLQHQWGDLPACRRATSCCQGLWTCTCTPPSTATMGPPQVLALPQTS